MPPTAIPSTLLSIATARSSIRNADRVVRGPFARYCPALVWSPKSPSSFLGQNKRPPSSGLRHSSERNLVADARALRRLRDGCGCGGGCSFVQNAVVNGEERQCQPVRHTDLVVDVAQVVLDHLLG